MESGHGSRKHFKTYNDTTLGEGDISGPVENADSPSSSSSSDTSLDDFFRVDGSHGTKLDEAVLLAPKDISSDRSPKSMESSDLGSQSDTFPMEVTVISPDSSLDGLSVTQSPPIQVMGRPGEPDPYRIPSSVFARSKSTTPMEWSVASNESLFSIHVGNNSFSRDHIFLMGRSGELTKSGELINFPDFPISPPPANSVTDSDKKKSTELGGNLGVTEAAAETVKEVLRVAAEDRNRQKTTPADGVRHSLSHSHRSDCSGASISSFAFPIKKRCAWPFCYCTWPLCYCCNFSWAFCYCCNGSRACCHCCKCSRTCCHCCNCIRACFHCCNCKRVNTCSCSSSTLTEGGRSSDSVKADSEQQTLKPQQSQPPTPGATPNAVGGKWFPCLSCCPFCC